MQERGRERDKWKSYHCRKLRRNAIKFTFLLGSLFFLRFHYAILRSNNELFRIFFESFAHGKSGEGRYRERGGYPWKDNESDEKTKPTRNNNSSSSSTNKRSKNSKNMRYFVLMFNHIKSTKNGVWWYAFFPRQYINIVTAGQKMKADVIEMTITFGMFVCVRVCAFARSCAGAIHLRNT